VYNAKPSLITPDCRIPDAFVGKRWVFRDELETLARRWRTVIRDAAGEERPLIGAVVPNTRDGIALVLALSSFTFPLLLLPTDPHLWRSHPPIPAGTPIVLPPECAPLAAEVARIACVPVLIGAESAACEAADLPLLTTPGIVMFTSGSTGLPKPAYRTMRALTMAAMTRLNVLGMEAGEGIVTGVPLAHGQGLTLLLSSIMLGGAFAVLGPFDHRAALTTIALDAFSFWWATPHFADVLGRCVLTAPARAPRVCLMSSPLSSDVYERFVDRFGVPLRQSYSSSETGAVAVNAADADAVRPDSCGRPLPGVDMHIGDSPAGGVAPGEPGRIWIRSRWLMAGYGFPPSVEPFEPVDGWWPTRDHGRLTASGELMLSGRIDDCIRTRDGRVVNLAAVSDGLRDITGVRDAVALALDTSSGFSIGAVVECDSTVTSQHLRQKLAIVMPTWSLPRELALVASIPRLASGKPDRHACLAILGRASDA
jgi:acyl-CoA synthetase (AMP-forming)/AMP-acid ligase II